MQKKIFIYGTEALIQKYLLALSLEYEILGFIKSGEESNDQYFYSKPLLSLDELTNWEFDLIVICSNLSNEVQKTLLKKNVTHFKLVDDLYTVKTLQSDISRSNQKRQVSILEGMAPPTLTDEHISQCKLLANREELLKAMKPDSIAAELGVAAGEYSKQIIDNAAPKKLHLIDLWALARFGEDLMGDVESQFHDNIRQGQVQIHRNSSIEVADTFEDEYFDWIYIDTDHSYQTTLAELRHYKNKIKSDGYLMGHDYVMGNWKKHLKYGVIEAVHQFCVEEGFGMAYLTMELNQSFAIKKLP